MQSDTGVVRAAAAVAESSGSGGVLHDVAKSTIALFLTTSVATISMGDIIMMVPMGVELQPLVESKESYGRRRHKAVFGLFKPPCFFNNLTKGWSRFLTRWGKHNRDGINIFDERDRERGVTSQLAGLIIIVVIKNEVFGLCVRYLSGGTH